ncbi:MAG: DUF4097 family beta strand repeat protein [Eubacterium sp.]|nr:DUF4097 family beta strand repeat protein [Eubacterium sp.]
MKRRKPYTLLLALMCIFAVVTTSAFAYIVWQNGKRLNNRIEKSGKPYEICFDESYSTDFKEVLLESDYVNVTVVNSPDAKTRLQIKGNKRNVKVLNAGGRLYVKAKTKDKTKFGVSGENTQRAEILIRLPEAYGGSLYFKSAYGKLTAASFPKATFTTDTEHGSLNITSLAGLKSKAEYADITVGEIKKTVDVETECGSVKVNTLSLNEDGRIECELGSINIGRADNVLIIAKTDLGTTKIRPNPSEFVAALNIASDSGTVTIN